MSKKQRVVITGGSGFVGSFLIEKLLKRGFKNILVIDKNPTKKSGVKCIRGDIFSNQSFFERYIKAGDTIIHLACSVTPSNSVENHIKDAEKNIVGTLELLEICKDRKIKKIIFASSGGAIYGNRYHPNKETDETDPINFYGAIKLAIEKYLYTYKHLYNIPYVAVRISNPYGRKILSKEKIGAIDVFLREAIEKKPIHIWGDGENVRDYIHIDDVTDFFVHAIEKDSIQGIYNIGTGKGTTLKQVLLLMNSKLGLKVRPKYRSARNVDVRFNVLNIKKAKKTGWRPKYTLIEGLKSLHRSLVDK